MIDKTRTNAKSATAKGGTTFSAYAFSRMGDWLRDHGSPPDLIQRVISHVNGAEIQINVAADGGEPIGNGRYSDGVRTWGPLRLPLQDDWVVTYDVAEHWSDVGFSGHNPALGVSHWVTFDVDALVGHAPGVGIPEGEMQRLLDEAQKLPYVEVRRSTSGNGCHLYVLVDAIPTTDRYEHAALARGVLTMMSEAVGYDFARQVDCCGGITWVGSRRAKSETSFQLVKASERVLTESDLPANWRDNIDVVARRRGKVRVRGVEDAHESEFELLTSALATYPLDDRHKALIAKRTDSGFSTLWIHDHHLLQTHTVALEKVLEQHRDELALSGIFRTNSPGSDPGSPNCFAFPLPDGAWHVYRFSPGVHEHPTWHQDGQKWTHCTFNHMPDPSRAALACGGVEMTNGKGFEFEEARQAIEAIQHLGQVAVELPSNFLGRLTQLTTNSDGRMIMRVSKSKDEGKPGPGWLKGRGDWWETVLPVRADQGPPQEEDGHLDDHVRRVKTGTGEQVGWMIRTHDDMWSYVTYTEAGDRLQCVGVKKADVKRTLGKIAHGSWTLVSQPFQPEYPGNRQWNMDAPQFRYTPTDPGENLSPHPHWDQVLEHCFGDLDDALHDLDWARDANITTGAQYARAWLACCLRFPFQPLPFLSFYGNQNCGKSIFHEAISLLLTKGVVSAARALTDKNGFNGELRTGVVAYVEEADIAASKDAYARMKEWTTAKEISIRQMRTDAYLQPNTLHFVMMANEQSYCPVLPGDTRITVIRVPDLRPDEEIPKHELLDRLREEAPYFLWTLLHVSLPPVIGRLRLPVVETDRKRVSQDLHRSSLQRFLEEECHVVEGEWVTYQEFYDRLMAYLPSTERGHWTKAQVTAQLPAAHPTGKMTGDNVTCIGNLAFEPVKPTKSKLVVVRSSSKVRRLKHES